MADTKISADYVANPFTWNGTEILPGIKSAANGAGLVSALQVYFSTLITAQNEAPPVTIGSSGSVAIGAAIANTITISGTNTITAFDTITAGATRRVVFSGILTLTHNATSLILPSSVNITTAVGDSALFLSLGAGNWRCVQFTRANGQALVGSTFTGGTLTSALNEAPPVTIASAASVAIGAAAANTVNISGTATITSFDTIAAGAVRYLIFAGALILTHNATSLILPGGANITTAAGDVGFFESLGSGNWKCLKYQKASGVATVVAPTPVLIQIACSDETTALTAGTAKVTFRAPYAFTLTDVRASVTTAPTGGTLLTVDVNEGGTTVISTKLTFDASEKTTTTAATPRVISDSAIADDAEITIDIDAIGSTVAGTGLKVTLVGTKP